MKPLEWPAKAATIDELLTVARDYALDLDGITHPEDIAVALTTAIDIAWRTVKPVQS